MRSADLRNISNALIDCQLNELNNRFHSDTYGLRASAAILMSPSLDINDTTLATKANSLNDTGKRFQITISESELAVFVQLIKRKKNRTTSQKYS